MSLDLSSVRAKVDRAATHLGVLYEIFGFNVTRDFEVRSEVDPVHQGHRIIYEGGSIPKDTIVGPVLGDFVHNARSALDHLICAVVRGNNVKVRTFHQYPFCVSRERFIVNVAGRDPARGKSCLDGMTPDQIRTISLHQPYIGRSEREARRSPLFLLHLAWNADKHRRIHTGQISLVGPPVITVTPSPPFTIVSMESDVVPGSFLEPDTEIAFVQVGTPRGMIVGDAQPNVEAHLAGPVAFRGERGVRIPFDVLPRMLRDVVWAVKGFDNTFTLPPMPLKPPPPPWLRGS